jgi:fumarate hydratase, class II
MATQEAYALKHVPIGVGATGKRKETDSMGEVEITTGGLKPSAR